MQADVRLPRGARAESSVSIHEFQPWYNKYDEAGRPDESQGLRSDKCGICSFPKATHFEDLEKRELKSAYDGLLRFRNNDTALVLYDMNRRLTLLEARR